MMAEARGVKRGNEEIDATPPAEWSVDEAVDFIAGFLPSDFMGREAILAAIRARGVDGAQLMDGFSDALMKEVGIKAFGKRKKIEVALVALRAKQTAAAEDDDVMIVDETPDGAGPAVDPAVVAAMLAPSSLGSSLEKEKACVAATANVAKNIGDALKARQATGWASEMIHSMRLRELNGLAEKCCLPTYSVVTVGNTGAGKSTLLNSLLGETEILPTNGMRACTAVLIEMTYDSDHDKTNRNYVGEVEFISKEEWEAELDDCLSELTSQDDRVILHVSNPKAHNYGSWCKLFAVYGEKFTHTSQWTGERGPDGKKVYKGPLVEEMRRILSRITVLTKYCGTTHKVSDNSAVTFRKRLERFTDSANEVAEGSCWPLVKLVRIRSVKWVALKPGITLVDAPGLNDSNASRNAVVSKYLRDADAIWIVSNITRAVNDKTAKDLLSKDFRRQLLMDGKLSGALAFVATQTDLLQRSEIIKSLKLPRATTTEECAVARNTFTKQRLQSDFYDGIAEMASVAGDHVSREELESRYRLPVFTVSSVDFQKLAGFRSLEDGPGLWADPVGTEIPLIVKHLHDQAILRRAVAVKEQSQAVASFAERLKVFCGGATDIPAATRQKAKSTFDAVVGHAPYQCMARLDTFEGNLNEVFDCDLNPSLADGAGAAEQEAMGKVQSWGSTYTTGGLHWATYKATIRRNGKFRIDMNDELAEPILSAVSTRWEKTFCGAVTKLLEELSGGIQSELKQALETLNDKLTQAGLEKAQIDMLKTVLDTEVKQKFSSSVGRVLKAVQEQQKELSRSVAPQIQEAMTPGYQKGFMECGTGSHRRRVAIVESHASARSKYMFQSAITSVSSALQPITRKMRGEAQSIVDELLESIGANYSACWEPPSLGCKAARDYLLPKLEKAEEHVKIALGELVSNIGPAVEDDPVDGLMIVESAAESAAQAAQAAASAAASAASSSKAKRPERPEELFKKHNEVIDDELEVVGSVGVLHTDLPHARFMCLNVPMTPTPKKFCGQCYCFVCDVQAALCKEWSQHCVATISNQKWLAERRKRKQARQ